MNKTVLLFLLLFNVSCYSQNESLFNAAESAQAGFSSKRLDQLRPAMQKYVDERKLPGMITMIARHGKIVYNEKYGLMDVNKPMQFNAVFRLASMTKPVTSVAVMMLNKGEYQGARLLKSQTLDLMTQFVPNFYYPVFREFREMVYNSLID